MVEQSKMKPPVLSEEEKLTCSLVDSRQPYKYLKPVIDEACIHQRDADVEFYEGQENDAEEGVIEVLGELTAVKQARQDTAKEIFEEFYKKCSVEAQRLDSHCGWDKLTIRRCDYQSLKSKYLGGVNGK